MSDQTPINLNVTDISDAVKVIDFACDQGAFRGWDTIRQVQALRDRLDLFVTAASAVVPEPDSAEPQMTAEEREPAETIAEDLPANSPRRQRRTRVVSAR